MEKRIGKLKPMRGLVIKTTTLEENGHDVTITEFVPQPTEDIRDLLKVEDFEPQHLIDSGLMDALKEVAPHSPSNMECFDNITDAVQTFEILNKELK